MSTKQKKSTRKITLNPSGPITQYFKIKKIKDREHLFEQILIKYQVEVRLNDYGILVIKTSKEKSEKIYNNFLKLDKLQNINEDDIFAASAGADLVFDEPEINVNDFHHMVFNDSRGKAFSIKPKTENQKLFIDKILENKVTLGIGSPGTGKSFLAIAVALKLLEKKRIKKIIISKPPIESGPTVGFLPGTLEEKLANASASFLSIIAELIGIEKREKLIKDGSIQIEHIGFLRGMTLGNRDSVVYILDEAQNIDFPQHKLILTRLGNHPESRIIYCGDQKQSDLRGAKDTLTKIHNIIKDSPYVGSVIFTKEDVVRSPVVRDLLGRIEEWEDKSFGV